MQSWTYRISGTICIISVRIDNVSGTLGLEHSRGCQV